MTRFRFRSRSKIWSRLILRLWANDKIDSNPDGDGNGSGTCKVMCENEFGGDRGGELESGRSRNVTFQGGGVMGKTLILTPRAFSQTMSLSPAFHQTSRCDVDTSIRTFHPSPRRTSPETWQAKKEFVSIRFWFVFMHCGDIPPHPPTHPPTAHCRYICAKKR